MKRLRATFAARLAAELADLLHRFKFLDESGVNLGMTRLYGRAAPGERVVEATPGTSGPHYTLVAALGGQGVQAPWLFEGAMTAHSGENDHSFRLMPITQSDGSRSPNPLDGDQLGRRPFGAERSDADRSMIHVSADQDKGVRVLRMDSPFSSRRWA